MAAARDGGKAAGAWAVNRREFIKTVAATVGVVLTPYGELPLFSASCEPDKWVIEEFNYGAEIGVAAQWGSGNGMIRQVVLFDYYVVDKFTKNRMIAEAKNVLRSWRMQTLKLEAHERIG